MPISRTELASRLLSLPEPKRSLLINQLLPLYSGKIDPLDTQYSNDLSTWIQRRLKSHLWSKQIEICQALSSHRRVAVKACHAPGKSFLVARLICAWICCHPPGSARVITSASTFAQVKGVLWHELGRAHSQGKLPGRLNQVEWWLPVKGREELVAVGRKPSDKNPTAFQGLHERFILVVFDESDGVGSALWDAADSLLANEESRFIAVGNPDDPTSEFSNVCKPGSGWKVITISAFDTPNFTGEDCPKEVKDKLVSPLWVEEKRKKWGEGSPRWQSKVLGLFPESRLDQLIPFSWLTSLSERSSEIPSNLPLSPIELGVDVGGGTNRNTICLRKGPVFSIIHRDTDPNTMSLLEKVIHYIRLHNCSIARVDSIGIGHGVVDRAKEITKDQELKYSEMKSKSFGKSKSGQQYYCTYQQAASRIIGVEVGRPCQGSDSEQYVNLRAKGYWELRERFEEGSIYFINNFDDGNTTSNGASNGAHEDLLAQLSALTYKSSRGRVQIEEKSEMKKRLNGGSPDEADSLMLCFLDVSEDSKEITEEFSYAW